MESFLDTIGEYIEVHSTFRGDVSKIPNHIVNHGESVTVIPLLCNCLPPPHDDCKQACFLNQI